MKQMTTDRQAGRHIQTDLQRHTDKRQTDTDRQVPTYEMICGQMDHVNEVYLRCRHEQQFDDDVNGA